MDISLQHIIFTFVGGLGLFLFGLKYMSDGLQAVAGDRMRTILEHGTKNPVRGVITGALVTALIQSSSATTVLTVGLVNARLLTLRQAIGIIMGANIGTTITAFLIGFNLSEYALPILALGALLFLFSKNKRTQMIGQALFGFGVLFFGLSVMGSGMKPIKDLPVFVELMTGIESNAILGVVIGTIFTMLVQSSSATTGVLQELANQGAITYVQAIPILFGFNIGTTVTALLAAIGASVAAKRTALTHFIFNVAGTLIFVPFLITGVFEDIIIFITNHIFIFASGAVTWENLNIKLQLAQTHAVFNVGNTLIMLPLVAALAFIVTKLIPDKEEEIHEDYEPQYIDKRFLSNPPVALSQATRETIRMGELSRFAFNNAIEYFHTRKEHLFEKSVVLEEAIDTLERVITDYVVLISQKSLSKENSKQSFIILQSLNDIERIGDHAENIVEQADYATRCHVKFSDEAKGELNNLIKVTGETIDLAFKSLETSDTDMAWKVVKNEQIIDDLREEYRKNHIRRLNEGKCNGNNGAVFLDVITNLERIGDHCRNIGGYVLGEYR